MIETLSKTCSVCGRERKKKDAILYDIETLTPYCANPYICDKENHPNAPKGIVKRGGELQLITAEDAKYRFNQVLREKYANPELMDRVSKLLTQPSTIRIQEVEVAEFIIKLMDSHGFRTKTDVFRYCILQAMKMENELEFYARKMEEEMNKPEPEEVEEEELPYTNEAPEVITPEHESLAKTAREEVTPVEEPKKEEVRTGEWDF